MSECTGPHSSAFDCPIHDPRKTVLRPVASELASQWTQVLKLAREAALARSKGGGEYGWQARAMACADLLAEIGVIHNTPNGKRDWIEGRE